MKNRNYLLEKLLLFVLYLDSLALIDQQYFLFLSVILSILSIYFEGARPYTPLIIFIGILSYFQFTKIQMIFVLLTGVLMILVKFYQIPIPGQGNFNCGYKSYKINDFSIGLFYPTIQKAKKASWFPNKNYFETLYQIFYVDPQTKRMPYYLFAFLVSFVSKIQMPAFLNTKLHLNSSQKQSNQNSFKVVIFSHGLGTHMNAYSSICGWFASHNFIVVSVQHCHDRICVDYRPIPLSEPQKIEKHLFKIRNYDLQIRTNELKKILDKIKNENILNQIFQAKINVEQIYLAGQSYGGATVLQAMAQLNSQSKANLVKSGIVFDPWMFPLSSSTYDNLKNQNICLINTQTFYERVPQIYRMQQKLARIQVNNKSTMHSYIITKMNHTDQCDTAFIFGNLTQIFKKDSHCHLFKEIMQLNLLIVSLYLDGVDESQIIQQGNKFCNQNGLTKSGLEVIKQFRNTREQMLQFKQKMQKKTKKEQKSKQN